jgi:hypothetical protein
VGLAETATVGRSFGEQRCGWLAEGIVAARGVRGPARRFEIVEQRFADAGVDLDAPYREPTRAGRHVL